MGKYPPLGQRGVSSTSAGTDFSLCADTRETLRQANDATHLMVMFEGDAAYERRESILDVEGIDMATVGPMDWSIGRGMFGNEANSYLAPKIDRLVGDIQRAGKIATMSVADSKAAKKYHKLGVRIFFLGVDVSMKRVMLGDALAPIKSIID